MVKVAQQNALAVAEAAKGEGNAIRNRAEGDAAASRLNGEGEASAIRAVGSAKADAYRQGIDAVGASGYTAMQLALILGENHVKLVPDVAVTGEGAGGGLANAMIAKLMAEGAMNGNGSAKA
jgi:regulator of protease activity HflC (stomatin/prohibitin superfamily)